MQLFVYEIDKYFTYNMFVHVIKKENYRQNFTSHTLTNIFLLLVNISLLCIGSIQTCGSSWKYGERSTERKIRIVNSTLL